MKQSADALGYHALLYFTGSTGRQSAAPRHYKDGDGVGSKKDKVLDMTSLEATAAVDIDVL